MTIDPYSPCPGGTGKKIKFCCSDLVHELDKLQRMIDGDQRVAGLDYVTKLDAKHPGRACLLSARATLEAMLGNRAQSAATLATFREKHPDNPIALSELAVLQATGERPTDAILSLQKALELSGNEMSDALYDAYGAVAKSLAEGGHVVPAQALLWYQVNISRGEDKAALQQWASLDGEPSIPLLLKNRYSLAPAPPGAPWRYEFDIALSRAQSGLWKVAVDKFSALIPIAGQASELWLNLGRLRSWLGDYGGATEALRKFAALSVPIDEAVEAEAIALELEMEKRIHSDAEPVPNPADLLLLNFAVNNQASLEERFAGSRQSEPMPIDPRIWAHASRSEGEDSPPPRAIYALLDRPVPSAGSLTRETVPSVLGTALLFGRQTDRAERLEFIVDRTDAANAKEQLARLGGDALGGLTAEEVAKASVDRDNPLRWKWRFPDESPIEQRSELIEAERRLRLLAVWPESPQADFEGQTPRQAAANPHLRLRVLALILIMELSDPTGSIGKLLDELRQQLGLPMPQPIDPTTTDLATLPRERLGRLIVEKLSDEELLRCFRKASFPPQRRTMAKLAAEIVARPSFAGRAEVPEAFAALLNNAPDMAAALSFVEQGRAAAQRAKQSTAPWDLEELQLRLQSGESDEATRLLQHLQREHAREPGVSEALFRMLYEAGIVDQQGRRIAPQQPQASPILVPGAAAPGKLLVPGGESAVPAGQSSKPVIWTPGME